MDAQTKKKFTIWQWRTIFVTMIGYALFYFVRKNFSFAMPGLAAEYGISNTSFGLLMTIVGLVYGFSRYFNGILADRMNARYHMSFGLFCCAAISIAFGFIPQILGVEIGTAPQILIMVFGILLVLINIFQGSGFPPCARLLAHWIPPQELATKQSIWNTSHSIGAFVLALFCGFIMSNMGSDVSNNPQTVENITYNYVTTLFKDDVKKSDGAIGKVIIKKDDVVKVENGYEVPVRYTLKENPTDTISETYCFSQEVYLSVQKVDKEIEQEIKLKKSKMTFWEKIEYFFKGEKEPIYLQIANRCNIAPAQAKATQVIVARTEHSGAWKYSFWLPGIIALIGALGLFLLLRDTPKSVGLPELESAKTSIDDEEQVDAASRKAFVKKMVYKNPIIWGLAFANFFVYVVRFSVLDWGPKFLTEACNMSYEKAGITVAAFEIMAIVGTLFAGWATDKFFGGRAHRTCLWCMVGAGAAMSVFYAFYLNPGVAPDWALIAVLAMAGFFVYGPQALIGIAAANHATKKAAATANGLVGIFGYLSTAVSGLGIGWLADHLGWNYVFIGVIAMAVIGMVVFLLMWRARRDGYDKA